MTLLKQYAELFDPQGSILNLGPKLIPLNYIINFQKAGTLFFMFTLMVIYNNFSLGAWMYLALHGSYGIVWIIKDMVFPDKSFAQKVSLPAVIAVALILLAYWGIGFLMMSRIADTDPSAERIFVCIFMYVIGLMLMVLTDMQKYMTLKYKKGLIDDYFLSNNRNTNYFGEVLLYSSFAVLVNHRWAFYFLFVVWATVFVSRIYLKELSLSKKDGYSRSDLLNILFYGLTALASYYIYNLGGIRATVKHFI